MANRQVGGVGASVDVQLASVSGPQVGGLGVLVEGTLPTGVNFGWLGALVEVIPALVTAGIGWSGTAFVASGGTPVLWGAGAFQSSGSYPVVTWEDDHFEEAP